MAQLASFHFIDDLITALKKQLYTVDAMISELMQFTLDMETISLQTQTDFWPLTHRRKMFRQCETKPGNLSVFTG